MAPTFRAKSGAEPVARDKSSVLAGDGVSAQGVGRGLKISSTGPVPKISRRMLADELEIFRGLIVGMRVGTYLLGLLFAAQGLTLSHPAEIIAGVMLGLYTAFRVFWPFQYYRLPGGRPRGLLGRWPALPSSMVALVLDAVIVSALVVLGGAWDSAFTPMLAVPVIMAGLADGGRLAAAISAVMIAIVGLSSLYHAHGQGVSTSLWNSGQWAGELLVMAVLTGLGRRLFLENDMLNHSGRLRVSRLAMANELLFELHQVTRGLPQSFDLGAVVEATVGNLREVISFDVMAIFVLEELESRWRCVSSEGLSQNELPVEPTKLMRTAIETRLLSRSADPADLLGFDSRSCIYVPLRSRSTIIGLLCVESAAPDAYSDRDRRLMHGLAEPAALAIDNARWFSRLRRLGADEERVRIARDLHDRLGQASVFLGYELDRLAGEAPDAQFRDRILEVRSQSGALARQVRETLAELRTDVSDASGLIETLKNFGEQISERSGIQVDVSGDSSPRPPVGVERELWRIAHEAMVNSERHSSGTKITVRWSYDGKRAILRVIDDGQGITSRGRADSFGVVGMVERAEAIGAQIEIGPGPQGGTQVTCILDWLIPTESVGRPIHRTSSSE